MARSKVKSRSRYDVAHLHSMFIPNINILQVTVSKIWTGQDFKGQGHYGKAKG